MAGGSRIPAPSTKSARSQQPRRKSLRNVNDSTENLHKLSRRAKSAGGSVDRTRTQQSNFAVSNIGNNGVIYLRPASRGSSHAPLTPSPLPAVPGLPASQNEVPPVPNTDLQYNIISGSDTTFPSPTLHQYSQHVKRRERRDSAAEADRTSSSEAAYENLGVAPITASQIRTGAGEELQSNPINTSDRLDWLDLPISNRNANISQDSFEDDLSSSALSRLEYHSIFPPPPGREHTGNSSSTGYALSGIKSGGMSDYERQLFEASMSETSSSVVRMSSATGDIVAASLSRLIAQITSPDLLDYVMLSDFFLTFRSFLSPDDLLSRLFARMRWAVNRPDGSGRKVRVRTFVALRHWVLNYFMEDFVPDNRLRHQFCEYANALDRDLRERQDGGGGDLKIVVELKKCWRSTCALYWDIPHGRSSPDEDIVPGGKMGSRDTNEIKHEKSNSNLAALTEARDSNTPQASAGQKSHLIPRNHTKNRSQQEASLSVTAKAHQRSATDPANFSQSNRDSSQVYSCSIPKAIFERGKPTDEGIGPHPVSSTKTKNLTRKSSMPLKPLHQHQDQQQPNHQRSTSDALRDERSQASPPNNITTNVNLALTRQIPGSLIRGLAYRPRFPYIETFRPSTPIEDEFAVDIDAGGLADGHTGDSPTVTGANPAVRKIIGSVRRAFSVKATDSKSSPGLERARSMHQSSGSKSASIAVHRRTLSGSEMKKFIEGRTQQRIDLLSLAALESFERVVEERKRNEAMNRSDSQSSSRSTSDGPKSATQEDGNQLKKREPQGSRPAAKIDKYGAPTANQAQRVKAKKTGIPTPKSGTSRIPKTPLKSAIRTPSQSGSLRSIEQVKNKVYISPSQGSQSHSSIPRPQPRHLRERSTTTPRAYRSMIPLPNTSPVSVNATPLKPTPPTKLTTPKVAGPKQRSSNASSPAGSYRTPTNPKSRGTLDASKLPTRQLRRKPGGDLRDADGGQYVTKPAPGPLSSLTKPREMSKMSTTKKDEELPAEAGRNALSMVSTHSSQPNLRPSFEAEVAKLAQLPDDDDGGVESTLLKLEGRYSKSPSTPTISESAKAPDGSPLHTPFNTDPNDDRPTSYALAGQTRQSVHGTSLQSRMPRTKSPSPSEQSYSSVPLLERGLSDTEPRRRKSPSEWLQVFIPPRQSSSGFESRKSNVGQMATASASEGSLVIVQRTKSMQDIPHGGTMPVTFNAYRSFLMDETQSLEDFPTSSDVSDPRLDPDNYSLGMRSFYDDGVRSIKVEPFLYHPLRHPETPPVDRRLTPGLFTDQRTNILISQGSTTVRAQRGIPSVMKSAIMQPRESEDVAVLPPVAQPAHLPFIMAYDSLQLAQQLTLIERDALAEIEWRDLIDLRWSQIVPSVRNWVQYLMTNSKTKSSDPPFHGGVDLVVARFNLMFKWALSEIIMTEDIYERAACIAKYIRIALHCRRLHNWATMCQITMALISSDCSRLTKTWGLVSDTNKHALSELENLITPMRNFANLRAEVDSSPAITTQGCIPFLGIYTHDLMYNAQKPSYIDNETSDEPLINFERHHTAASIVKGLLGLIEASSRYDFKPIGDLLSRCLWVAALNDDEIAKKSRVLEP